MRIGVVFPQTEIGTDVAVIRDYAQAAEGLGYSHVLVYDHVLGASTAHRPDWSGPYTSETLFHEPFVLFGYLAAITQQMELVTGVIILPQRQTALVAKQVAEVDVLSNGRVRLGVGIGWNPVEYEALNEEFGNRGKRIEEQITVLRELWSSTAIDFTGRWHRISEAGINPLPVQRAIPIWLGGHADPVLERTGRMADGWFPQMRPNDIARAALDKIYAAAEAAGRTPKSIGIEARLNLRGDVDSWREQVDGWQKLGATHLSINTMGIGLSGGEHIGTIERVKGELGL